LQARHTLKVERDSAGAVVVRCKNLATRQEQVVAGMDAVRALLLG